MANFNFNKVILGGRLTADPILEMTSSDVPFVSFTIAVNRRFGSKAGEEPRADFFNVTAWRQTAGFINRYFRKANSICIVGSIQTRSWTDQQGQKRFATEIVADEAYFVDAKNEMPTAAQKNPVQAVSPASAPAGDTFGQQDGMFPQQPYTGYIPEAYLTGMQDAVDELPF